MKIKTYQLIVQTIILFLVTALIPQNILAQKQGLAAIDSMKTLLKPNKVDTHQIKLIYRISSAYTYIDADSAMHYGQSGLKWAKKINWPKGIGGMYDNLGTLYNNNGDYKKALFYYNEALKINKRIGNRRGEAGNIINIGTIYYALGNEVQALENAFKALRITLNIKEENYTALLYGNIADIYTSNKDYKKALSYSLKAYQLYRKLKDINGLGSTSSRIGTVYYLQNNLKKAELYFNKSLESYTYLENKLKLADIYSKIALLHEDDKDKKLSYLFKAQQKYDETKILNGSSITNTGNIGGTYAEIYIYQLKDKIKTHNFIPKDYPTIAKKAEFYLKKAVNESKKIGDQDNLSYFSDNLAQLQERNGQYKEALQNFKTSQQITDSLYSQESKNQIATLEAQFAFQKKEDQYKQQQELAKVKTQQIYLFASLAIVLISSILLYLLNRSNINQLRLKNQLLRKEAEERTKELLHQSRLFESELKAIRSQMNPHFIFNVLNSIESYIMDNDKRTASRLVQKFASLSRLILENSTKSLVTADKEWKALMLYTELEAMRYNDSFTYTFTVADDIQLKTLYLPPMLIQPLIENAILHGLIVNPKADAHLAVTIKRKEDKICITVEDNGVGIGNSTNKTGMGGVKEMSMGLASIQERIDMINKQHAGNRANFTVKSNTYQSGTTAVVCLPFFLTGSLDSNHKA
jgi:tetratricopeptide (TPR) repeat protein